jgi:alpha-glucuronidase
MADGDLGAGGSGGGVVQGSGGVGPTGGAPPIGGSGGALDNTGGVVSSGGMLGSAEEYPLPTNLPTETGGDLWLRYPVLPIPLRLAEYQAALAQVVSEGNSATLDIAVTELVEGLSGLTGVAVTSAAAPAGVGAVLIGTPVSSPLIASSPLASSLPGLGDEGYLVQTVDVNGQSTIVVAANSDVGVLYGSYALLRHLQNHSTLEGLSLSGSPKIQRRLLNHWDNLDGSVERGYAGASLWDWGGLPGTLSPRYETYARANASIGINGTVLTNVNADEQVLTPTYLAKVKALADVFRPYGIRVYLTAPYNSAETLGGLGTSDPLDPAVQAWWSEKATEIYDSIPDFGGFLIKANSEGQPGPESHSDGANMLAEALAPHGGIVMWRAFVYANESQDRIREAYDEFQPLDGQFDDNAMVQVKNGPLDFQPREPFSSLFGAMPSTPLVLELQITKEYLGQNTHLAYLGTMWEEVLQTDTYADGPGSTVARVVDGTLHDYPITAIAGVANVGTDANWSGSHFNQANWYAFGRMAWDPDATAAKVAEEWIRLTLSNDPLVVAPVMEMMMSSRQAVVDYMTPLGLVHLMATTHHYGPGPWVNDLAEAAWNPFYYHKADSEGIGFDRTASGSNAIEQYADEVTQLYGDRASCPDDFLLFFHRVGWQETLASGRTLWQELVHRYSQGVDDVGVMRDAWATVAARIDAQRFGEVSDMLEIQHFEARWWRDACVTYFASAGGQTMPAGYATPANALSFYQSLTCPPDVTKPTCSEVYVGEPSPAITP